MHNALSYASNDLFGLTAIGSAHSRTCYDDCSAWKPVWEDTNVHKVGPSDMPCVWNLAGIQYMHKSFISILLLHSSKYSAYALRLSNAVTMYHHTMPTLFVMKRPCFTWPIPTV